MTITRSTADVAALSKTTHSRTPNAYLKHGTPLKPGKFKGDPIAPPEGSLDGSAHLLNPPTGAEPVSLRWVAAESAWEFPGGKGHRMAFTGKYLASHGWTYNRAE